MTRETQKRTAIQAMFESIKLYITMVQPSSVIIWKMLSMAQARLSKLTIPYIISFCEWGSSIEAGKPASLGSLQKRSGGHSYKPCPSLLHRKSKLGSYGQVPSSRGNSVKRQRRYMVPSNYWIPRIPKSMKMKSIKATALRSESTEPMSDETSFLIFGKALMLRRGRKTRSVLSARTLNQLKFIISSMPVTTTIVSSQFHASFKYAFLWKMRP